jgi:hypothetical protein
MFSLPWFASSFSNLLFLEPGFLSRGSSSMVVVFCGRDNRNGFFVNLSITFLGYGFSKCMFTNASPSMRFFFSVFFSFSITAVVLFVVWFYGDVMISFHSFAVLLIIVILLLI